MLVIFLEALLALALFVLLVWWTMFSGRKRGELLQPEETASPKPSDASKNTNENGL